MIIGCDGVWDVLHDKEAADILNEHKEGFRAGHAARALVSRSFQRLSDDNTTAIMVMFENRDASTARNGDGKSPSAKRQRV